ncbi:MAG: amino acid decarboxylase [Gemmatimonadetes bacterium]|uniref:Amino acid decarboxylase n=1 Tax=Candidatus Kutchimonas denitrificans TaxID=3056748 RepID=A0AAE5CCH8_9BACT|nr:amino acid decarboxylase [Gemmatimonadota bacterium]NIR74204.1 amino acid decarboxylase [Candidatus Kutchimonas denitrificans]NIR99826.1 amino acid decarboxylase [Gemmatimonadota bacterium]NIT65415.1 amino acid decarboxylase [Gemmatimonadota bacterium]NIU51780.1 amino acid decarboxylase [Gemmatimonadota bacterium]
MDDARDVPVDEFKHAGVRALDWIASYLSDPDRFPVLPPIEPGAVKAALPESAPDNAEPLDQILDDYERVVVPGITHWNHPSFFAYFGITGSAPGILGELLSSALNVNAMLWQTAPAATELEAVALDWLRQLLGLPAGFAGVIMDTASVSTLCAVAAARHALSELEIRERGMSGRDDLPLLRLYTSEQAHSSVEKAALVLGLGQRGVRKIPTDNAFRMDAAALEAAIDEDASAGYRPFCVVATVGTTSTTSIDPVPEIARICERRDLWLHVDAAYAGSAAIVPEYRHLLAGCDAAHSIVVNPHKWLFTPIDCSALYTRDAATLTGAFSLVPEYLRTSVDGEPTNYMDWGVSLGRRFRGLKLWMVLRAFGAEGIRKRLANHIEMAQRFAAWVDEDPGFERLAPTPLSVVCFRARPPELSSDATADGAAADARLNEFNEKLLQRLNASGEVYLSHTRLNGKYALRLAIGNVRTTEAHVTRAWELIRTTASAVLDQWQT